MESIAERGRQSAAPFVRTRAENLTQAVAQNDFKPFRLIARNPFA
jgi:hypothetical protein